MGSLALSCSARTWQRQDLNLEAWLQSSALLLLNSLCSHSPSTPPPFGPPMVIPHPTSTAPRSASRGAAAISRAKSLLSRSSHHGEEVTLSTCLGVFWELGRSRNCRLGWGAGQSSRTEGKVGWQDFIKRTAGNIPHQRTQCAEVLRLKVLRGQLVSHQSPKDAMAWQQAG